MVINMSFGADIGTTEYNALDLAVQAAIDAGITVVIAAGNEGIDASTITPAHVADAITVGAYDVYNRFAYFSNYGPIVDLQAPGVDILSTGNGTKGSWKGVLMSGTSTAAPHVAGAAALYLSQHPSASPAEVREALLANAIDIVHGAPVNTTTRSVWVGNF